MTDLAEVFTAQELAELFRLHPELEGAQVLMNPSPGQAPLPPGVYTVADLRRMLDAARPVQQATIAQIGTKMAELTAEHLAELDEVPSALLTGFLGSLTDEQRAELAELTPEQRAEFDSLPPAFQASLLADGGHLPDDPIFRQVPAPSRVVPEEWQPNERHRQAADEMNLDVAEEAERFRAFEFRHPVFDWHRRFGMWLVQSGVRRNGVTTDESQASRPRQLVRACERAEAAEGALLAICREVVRRRNLHRSTAEGGIVCERAEALTDELDELLAFIDQQQPLAQVAQRRDEWLAAEGHRFVFHAVDPNAEPDKRHRVLFGFESPEHDECELEAHGPAYLQALLAAFESLPEGSR